MASVDLLAGTVLATSSSLLNDTARTVYTYAVGVPYLNIALQELREFYELHGIASTKTTSAIITMVAGKTVIAFNAVAPEPSLPSDLVEPNQLWEREQGIDPWRPMVHREFLPHHLEGEDSSRFTYYTWNSQQIEVLSCNRANEIKIDYIKQLFTPIVDETSVINVINAQTFLEFRTAALMAEFIERNKESSDNLNVYAKLAIERATGIAVKGKQNVVTRRRPFRATYKKRSGPF